MEWTLDKSYPICSQIQELICLAISNNEYKINDKIYSIRECAVLLGVNPNTVQKAYLELEDKKIIYSIRGSGWYVNDNVEGAKRIVEKLIEKKTREYLINMKKLGLSKENIIEYIKKDGDK